MSVDTITVPALATVPNVELMHTGSWPISTGLATFTTEDLYQAVAATGCPAVRNPVLKLGHMSELPFPGDGKPVVGWVKNMQVAEAGRTLVGDYTNMPGWMGPIVASAYPDRSIEGQYDYVCQMGHTHPFVLTAVALLGDEFPGIGSLESLQDKTDLDALAAIYGVAATASAAETGTVISARATVAVQEDDLMPNPDPKRVSARVTTEDVQRKFYAAQDSWDTWIESMELGDPTQLIVMNDATGARSRVTVSVGAGEGEEAVSFGEPVPVIVRYEDAAVAASAGRNVITFASKAESRPDAPNASATESENDNTKEAAPVADYTEVAKRLGLAEDTDEATILAALDDLADKATAPAPVVPTPAIPEGLALVDASVLSELREQAAAGVAARVQQVKERREALLASAVKDGRISRASRSGWEKRFEVDAEGAEVDLASLTPGLVPMAAAGHGGTVDGAADATLSEADIAATARAFGGLSFSEKAVY
jgi:hypothetical protein